MQNVVHHIDTIQSTTNETTTHINKHNLLNTTHHPIIKNITIINNKDIKYKINSMIANFKKELEDYRNMELNESNTMHDIENINLKSESFLIDPLHKILYCWIPKNLLHIYLKIYFGIQHIKI